MTPTFPGPWSHELETHPPQSLPLPESNALPDSNAADRMTADEKEVWWICEMMGPCVRSGQDFQSCLEQILKAAMDLTGAEIGSLRLLDRETGALKIWVQQGLDSSILDAIATLRLEDAPKCGLSLREGKRTVVEDLALSDVVNMPGLAGALLNAGIRAFQSTPLVSTSGNVVGAVSTHFPEPHRPAPRQLRLLDLLARQAADYVERVQAEQEVAYRAELLGALLENAPLGACVMDSSFSIRHANPAAAQILGEAPELAGRNLADLLHRLWNQEYADAIVQKCRRTLQTGKPGMFRDERALRAGQRELEYHEWRLHRILLPEGEPGLACYFRDVSARVRAQLKIHDQEERLLRVVKLAAAGQIASSLAHEINNPLSAVTNALYLLGGNADLNAGAKDLVSAATAELARVARIVRQSLSYYRTGAVLSELDLGALVEERISFFAETFAATGIEVERRMISAPRIAGVAEEIRQVIDNLLVNALEAMPAGGRLTVSLSRSRTWNNHELPGIRLIVADTGLGIARENIQRIFDPFFTTKPEGGRGLGLWVVRGIVGKHDGILSIRSRETKGRSGTVVSIVWPLTLSLYGGARLARPGAAA